MGRPSGSMEKKLTTEEIAAIVGRCQMPENAVNQLKADAVVLFSKAADDAIPITRRMVKENLWILKELVSESPSQIIHADSIAAVLMKIFLQHTKNIDDKTASVLSLDLKALMQNLRKTWRAWKHLAKKDALVGWPPCAQRDPQLLEVIAMIDETSDTKADDAAEVERIALAWNVGVDAVVDDPPPDFLEQLEKKRASVVRDLQGKVVVLDSDKEELPELPKTEVKETPPARAPVASSGTAHVKEASGSNGGHFPMVQEAPPAHVLQDALSGKTIEDGRGSTVGQFAMPEESPPAASNGKSVEDFEEVRGSNVRHFPMVQEAPPAHVHQDALSGKTVEEARGSTGHLAMPEESPPAASNGKSVEDVEDPMPPKPPAVTEEDPVAPEQVPKDGQKAPEEKKRTPAAKDKRDFLVKVHKRKGKDEKVFMTYAIYDNVSQKQLVQLTESTKDDARSIIESTVQSLNEGTMTREDAVAAISAYKGIMPTS